MFKVVQRRKWLILLAVVIGLGVGYLYVLQQPLLYESSTRIHIVETGSPTGAVPGSGPHSQLADQAIVLGSQLIVSRAIAEHPGLANLSRVAIHQNLKVSNVNRSPGLIDLSFTGPDPIQCQAVVAAIATSYEGYLDKSHEGLGEETVDLISQARQELLVQLEEKEAAYQEFREQTEFVLPDDEGTSVHAERLANIEGARSDLLLRRGHVQSLLRAVDAALERGESRDAILLMLNKSPEKDGETSNDDSAFEERLLPLLLDEQRLLKSFGRDHPDVIAVREKIQMTRELLGMSSSAVRTDGGEQIDMLALRVDSLKQELAALDEEATELSTLYEQESRSAKSLALNEIRNATFLKEIARTEELFDAVVGRLEEINLIKAYPGLWMQVLTPPQRGELVSSVLSWMGTAGLLGLLVGGVLALLVEGAQSTRRRSQPREYSQSITQ